MLEIYTSPDGTDEKTWYTHGAGVDEHLALERGGHYYFYHADGLGSVTALTDADKNIVQSYRYDSFGMLFPSSSFRNSYCYTGREWDREAGLYYYRARYYDPRDGRFISKDPIGIMHTDLHNNIYFEDKLKNKSNLYIYAESNTINYTDPFGLTSWNGNFWGIFVRQDGVCSPPAEKLNSNECAKKCCKEHDNCYTKYGCNQSSWIGNLLEIIPVAPILNSSQCQLCNLKAVECIVSHTIN